ncbi:DUF4249 domain-containing protein [Marinilabiliaceae bacterium JC017]|nr:DUF4249 domain-containing protein [Marinilabiliaceae bacterium JC017]
MMRLLKAIFIVALVLFYACTEEMTLELSDSKPHLVVDGSITTDTMSHMVRLSMSGNYFANEAMKGVSGAHVTVSDGSETIVLKEFNEYPGLYFTPQDYYGVEGKAYSLKIEGLDIDADGKKEIYEARDTLKSLAPIDSIRLEWFDEWNRWKILLYAKEPGEAKDFYTFGVAINDSLYTDQLSEWNLADDKFFDGNYVNGAWVQDIDMDDEDIDFVPGDTVTLLMGAITEDFFDYSGALKEETSPKVPLFSGPPANLPGNISNGALGYFRTLSLARSSTIHTGEQ